MCSLCFHNKKKYQISSPSFPYSPCFHKKIKTDFKNYNQTSAKILILFFYFKYEHMRFLFYYRDSLYSPIFIPFKQLGSKTKVGS